jgi:hypothetical protein
MQMPLTAAMIGFLPLLRGSPARPGAVILLTTPDLFISFHSIQKQVSYHDVVGLDIS